MWVLRGMKRVNCIGYPAIEGHHQPACASLPLSKGTGKRVFLWGATMDDSDYIGFYPGFTVTCNKCGGKHVRIESSCGYSPESGAWGSVDMVCDDCETTVTIYQNY